ncbi:MAG TPA: hydrogenase expression/formation protein [Telmatospirillum sp.]|nr:hydrogenase expression/formation protein [Telmatospirillum sp.]
MSRPSVTDALIALAPQLRPTPCLLDDIEGARHAEVKVLLLDMLDGLRRIGRGETRGCWFDATPLDPEARSLLSSMLGQGEVSVTVTGPQPVQIRESTLQGLWMVDGPGRQGIELADLPEVVLRTVASAGERLDLPAVDALPAGAMNVLPVLAEIKHHMGIAGDPHEINLTLLPMTEVDLQMLDSVLGQGAVEIWARGYGSCRIVSCAAGQVWRIHYFNSEDRMILDLIQVGGVPVAARATEEDMAESAVRLEELISAYFPKS